MEDTAAINVKIEMMNEKVKDQSKAYLILKKEKEEQIVMNQSIQKKLGDVSIVAE